MNISQAQGLGAPSDQIRLIRDTEWTVMIPEGLKAYLPDYLRGISSVLDKDSDQRQLICQASVYRYLDVLTREVFQMREQIRGLLAKDVRLEERIRNSDAVVSLRRGARKQRKAIKNGLNTVHRKVIEITGENSGSHPEYYIRGLRDLHQYGTVVDDEWDESSMTSDISVGRELGSDSFTSDRSSRGQNGTKRKEPMANKDEEVMVHRNKRPVPVQKSNARKELSKTVMSDKSSEPFTPLTPISKQSGRKMFNKTFEKIIPEEVTKSGDFQIKTLRSSPSAGSILNLPKRITERKRTVEDLPPISPEKLRKMEAEKKLKEVLVSKELRVGSKEFVPEEKLTSQEIRDDAEFENFGKALTGRLQEKRATRELIKQLQKEDLEEELRRREDEGEEESKVGFVEEPGLIQELQETKDKYDYKALAASMLDLVEKKKKEEEELRKKMPKGKKGRR